MSSEVRRGDGESRFGAWSRRKRAALRKEAEAKASEAEVDESTVREEEASTKEYEADADYIESLPSIDEINGETDLHVFMKRGVPEHLRNAALRKVWMANSLIRDHDDPAVDYAWDWNSPEGVPGAGGSLNGDRVSKMVDDLVNQNRPEDENTTDQSERTAEGNHDTSTSIDEPVERVTDTSSPSDASGVSGRTSSVEQTAESHRAETESSNVHAAFDASNIPNQPIDKAVLSSRRHGGALPK